MVIADLDVGVLYTFGIVSLAVYGIVLAGYARLWLQAGAVRQVALESTGVYTPPPM